MKREKNDINIAVQKLINYICKHQLEILNVYYSWTRTWQIVCMVYHKYVNLFFCTSKNSKAYAFMYAFFPIGYHTLSTECPWFSLFFLQHTIRIVLFCWMFFTMVRIGVSNPSQKYHPLFLAKPPLKSWNCPKPPFLGNPPL